MAGDSKSKQIDIEARRRYEAARKTTLVACRLSENEIKSLDAARGKSSRAAYVTQALRKSLGIK